MNVRDGFKAASKKSILIMLVLCVGACAVSTPYSDWPVAIPPVKNFTAVWRNSGSNQNLQTQQDYLSWVVRFYAGYNLAPGWLNMTEQVLDRTPEAQHRQITAQLQKLGESISAEWAKDNAVRRVDTRVVAVWRDALMEAVSREEVLGYLKILEQDVSSLLAGRMADEAVSFERYYVDEFDL